jgi:hypothetical protein
MQAVGEAGAAKQEATTEAKTIRRADIVLEEFEIRESQFTQGSRFDPARIDFKKTGRLCIEIKKKFVLKV